MTASTRSSLLGLVVLFGLFARAASYKAPLLDHHAWRQADTASIARNFARERFNPLYPQVDWRGARAEGYVETGFEAFAFIVAGVSKLTGFRTEIGRLLSALLFVASGLMVWRLARRRYGDEAGLVAAFCHAFAFPLLLFIERAFMNESMLICLSLASLLAAQRYLECGSKGALAALVAATSLIAVIKVPYLIVWAPIAGLFVERDGLRAFRRWELALIGAVNLGVAFAWYWHAHQLGAASGLSFGLTDKLFDAGTVLSLDFPLTLLDRMVRDILEPIGLVAVAVGGWHAVRQRRHCETFGLLGFAAYLVIVGVGNRHHDYYQLALMPVASLLAAPGMIVLSHRFGCGVEVRRERALVLLLGAAALCTFVRLASAHSWFEYSPDDVTMCAAIGRETAPEDRVVFVGDNNPQLLHCADRKGWLLSSAESTEARVREALEGGARVVVLSRSLENPAVRQLIAAAGPALLSNQAVEVFRWP
jgi:4-amino-4-deoxy-L-arabinose transferase-like glycosyltransferase